MKRTLFVLVMILVCWMGVSGGTRLLVNPPQGVASSDTPGLGTTEASYARAVAEFNQGLAVQMQVHHCQPVADWKRAHPGQYPGHMLVHRDGSARIERVRWTYPAAPGYFVDGLCT